MSEIAGRVLMIPKGTYSPTTTYDPLDAVKYEQNSYVCKQTSRGNLPTNTTYWQPLTDVTADEIPTEGSTNLVQSGGVYSALTTINQTLTSAFVNNVNVNGSKNLFSLDLEKIIENNKGGTWNGSKYTANGGEFTLDNNSITFGGTPTDVSTLYILLENITPNVYMLTGLSGCTNVRWNDVVLFKNGVQIDTISHSGIDDWSVDLSSYDFDSVRFEIKRASNSVAMSGTCYPMLCLKSDYDLDPTYAPPTKTNRQLTEDSATWDVLSEVGAVNYCNFDIASGTKKGYTFTNDKGVIHVTGSRATGETGNVDYRKDMSLKAGTYRVSGCPSGGGPTKWRLLIAINNSTQYAYDYGDGDGAVFTLDSDSDDVKVYCTIMSNYSDSVDMYFKPMIAPASYNGPYVPPAKTNKELTDDLTTVHSGILTVDSENADLQWNYGGASANNIAMSFKGFISTKRDATSGENSWINIGTLSKKPKVAQQIACPRINNSEGTIVCTNISIDTSGNVLFNMRSGMKSGDQFTTAGVILL